VLNFPRRLKSAGQGCGDQTVVHMAQKLDAGTIFPTVQFTTVRGGTVTLPEDITSSYEVVLFFRGHW
jgi:hypothetical protein